VVEKKTPQYVPVSDRFPFNSDNCIEHAPSDSRTLWTNFIEMGPMIKPLKFLGFLYDLVPENMFNSCSKNAGKMMPGIRVLYTM
jgi:hypothetical protein